MQIVMMCVAAYALGMATGYVWHLVRTNKRLKAKELDLADYYRD